jgi:hypothetical protein
MTLENFPIEMSVIFSPRIPTIVWKAFFAYQLYNPANVCSNAVTVVYVVMSTVTCCENCCAQNLEKTVPENPPTYKKRNKNISLMSNIYFNGLVLHLHEDDNFPMIFNV